MRPWQFGKPKTPGFGISGSYYLSVLSSKPVFPSILEVINPGGAGGAAEGFGAPLKDVDKEALAKPIEHGEYVISTKDKKTVLKMLVADKSDVGYDPEVYAQSPLALQADPELLARMRGTWTIAQLAFVIHDPMVYPALDFLLGVCTRMAYLTDGVVADAICERYLLPEDVIHRDRVDPLLDVRDHVSVGFRLRPDGLHAFTLGMQKFVLPEFEMTNLFDEDQELAQRFLLVLCQSVLLGDLLKSGERIGSNRAPFEVREGGFDRDFWRDAPVFELLPPTSGSASDSLQAWMEESR